MELRIKNRQRALLIAFTLIVIMIAMLGIVSKILLTRMANTMNQLYAHPYKVSNMGQEIKFNLVSMQTYLKDAVFAQTQAEQDTALVKLKNHETKVLQSFDLVSDLYLGEKQTINESYRLVIQWQPIRNEIIRLSQQGKQAQALALMKGKQDAYLDQLMAKVQTLSDFANHKAEGFQQDFLKEQKNALWMNYVLSFLSTFFIILLAMSIIRKVAKLEQADQAKDHLIDQNIMLASLDKNGIILNVSNALCRFLDKNKAELIGQDSHFFDNSKRSQALSASILSVLKTGAEWRGEIQYINHQGKSCWAQSSIVPNYDKNYTVSSFTNTLVSTTNQKLAIIDELTSLYNRRGFNAILSREYQHAQRDQACLSLAILDIDYFKKFNDLYGHPAGDEALRKVSSVILSVVDETCFAFRIGGEEFAVLFIGASIETTKQKLLWLKEQVESLNIQHEQNLVSEFLTLSIGTFVLAPKSHIEEGRLYSMADKALYQAKLERNALVIKQEPFEQELIEQEPA